MAVFSVMAFSPYVSFLSIAFFVWNFFNKKAFLTPSLIFFCVAIFINVLNWHNEIKQREFINKMEQLGYHSEFKATAQQFLNIFVREVESYKKETGYYPNQLSEINSKTPWNSDLSFMIKLEDGKVTERSFYYKKIGPDKFYLSSVGPDGIGETKDDLVPEIFHFEEKSTGLIKYALFPICERDLEHGYVGSKAEAMDNKKESN